jgi:hypothetical protein
MAVALAPASSADVTIGANVNTSTLNSGTCGFESMAERPCTFITSTIPGQTMTAPCAGTVTRFRLNGFVRPANHYRLRVVRRNADGSFTGTASSAPVSIASEGVNEYATSLPVAAGEQIGIDFLDSTEDHGLRWAGPSPEVGAAYFYAFPADGGSAFPTGSATFYYLFNADIACASANPGPAPAPAPSNVFKVVKLKATTLTLELASAGAVAVTDANAKAKKAKASASKAKPKLLKPSNATGGPGQAKVKLKLTGAAKKTLKAKGKVKVKAKITFTPTGGTASTQVKTLTVKTPRPKHAK